MLLLLSSATRADSNDDATVEIVPEHSLSGPDGQNGKVLRPKEC